MDMIVKIINKFLNHCINMSIEADDMAIKRKIHYIESMAKADAWEKRVYEAICIQPSDK